MTRPIKRISREMDALYKYSGKELYEQLVDDFAKAQARIAELEDSNARLRGWLEHCQAQGEKLDTRIATLEGALEWVADIADKNYDADDKLRSNGARTLARISDRARAAL
jgi:predicted  nucleic acid-binding Zn-ribbon protein